MSRRWLQFSLRGFLLATTVFAVWLGFVAEKAVRQKEAVGLLEAWGATIDYDHLWQGPFKPPKKTSPPGWVWLRKLLGPHYFDKVVNIELLAGWRSFTASQEAAARKGKVPELPRLLVLTDAEFVALGHLPDLRRLEISGELQATEVGLQSLGHLKRLETLMLNNTSGKSSGGVNDAALVFIERMPLLKSLYLEGNSITDEGVARVRWPPGLVDLDLSGTKITDAGLEHLKKITSLKRLVIMDCRVTAAGIADFQNALPTCSIVTRR